MNKDENAISMFNGWFLSNSLIKQSERHKQIGPCFGGQIHLQHAQIHYEMTYIALSQM